MFPKTFVIKVIPLEVVFDVSDYYLFLVSNKSFLFRNY